MAARKTKVGWRAVWRDFMKWFREHEVRSRPSWTAQKRKIAELVEAQIAKKKAKPKKA